MTEKIAAQKIEENQLQLIVFRVGDEEFGVPIEAVQEIIKATPVTPIPDMPKFIKGLINVRGDVLPAIDVRARFLLPADDEELPKHVVITQQEGGLFGLMVDEVTEILRISENQIKPTPKLITKVHKDFVSGVVTNEGRLIVLLDLTKVLTEGELNQLSKVTHKKGHVKKKLPENHKHKSKYE